MADRARRMDKRIIRRTLVKIDQGAVVRCDSTAGSLRTNRYCIGNLYDEKKGYFHPSVPVNERTANLGMPSNFPRRRARIAQKGVCEPRGDLGT